MYSTDVAEYQVHLRNAFEALWLKHGVDLYVSAHVHWYERLFPLGNGTIDNSSIISKNIYKTNPGISITHIVNGMAGNVETHTLLGDDPILPMTNVLNNKQFGFSKLTVHNRTALQMEYIRGDAPGVGDSFYLLKK